MSAVRERVEPTARDMQVLAYVQKHQKRYSCAPTRAEIAAELKISRPTAEGHLQALQQHGYLTLRTCWRGIFLTAKGAA
jgi:Mn-dependent DtxR family transcriptional regulator